MDLFWLWPLMTLVAVAVVLVFVAREIDGSTGGRVERTFVCPTNGQEVTALLQSDFFDPDHFRDVLLCSRFGMNRSPQCGRACLAMAKSEIAAQDATRLPVYSG